MLPLADWPGLDVGWYQGDGGVDDVYSSAAAFRPCRQHASSSSSCVQTRPFIVSNKRASCPAQPHHAARDASNIRTAISEWPADRFIKTLRRYLSTLLVGGDKITVDW